MSQKSVDIDSVKDHVRYQCAYQILDEQHAHYSQYNWMRHSHEVDIGDIEIGQLKQIRNEYRDDLRYDRPL